MSTPTIEQLAAMIAQLQGETEAPTPDNRVKAEQFSSLGFVVVGNGNAPSEGDTLQVPTKAGKVANVRVLNRIDTSGLETEANKFEWAFTYKRLKRGES